MNRLIILVPCFHDGGVETWAQSIITHSNKLDVHIIVHGEISQPIKIKKEKLHRAKSILEIALILFRLKVCKKDVVFSSLTPSNLRAMILKPFFRFKHIVGVQVTLMKLDWESNLKYIFRKLIYKLLHLTSDKVFVASSGLAKEITKNPSKKIEVFWNPIITAKDIQKNYKPINERDNIVLAVGRLELQKDFNLLIDAAIELQQSGQKFKVIIVGEGSLKKELNTKIENHGLATFIEIHPFTEDIFKYYHDAKVFVLSSIYEGFGNVLAEALFLNCYCISFDINHGPRDILDGGKYGVLINDRDPRSLAREIVRGLNFKESSFVQRELVNKHGMLFTAETYCTKMEGIINELL